MKICLLVACGGLLLSAGAAPVSLTCEYRSDPIALETAAPRLGWQTDDGQVAWRVRVASTQEKLAAGEADLWDSGKVSGSDTYGIVYGGAAPHPSQRAYWQVKTWTASGESGWSAPARWQWGMLGRNWQAKWISAGSVMPTPCFAKKFTVKAKPVTATLHITGLGYYEASLNGRRIGTKVLDPAPTDYTKTVLYSTYQLEDDLRIGENTLSVIVGHGLYCVRALSHWWFERAPWKAPPCMLARLELTYPDGSEETVVTDRTWRQVKSPVGYDDFREGEVVGAWHPSLPDYGTAGIPALERPGPRGVLKAESQHPAEVVETFAPVSIHSFDDGAQVVEFPKDISGWVRLTIRDARKGDVVSVRYDERVEKDFSPVAPSPGDAFDLREPAAGPDRRRIDCYFEASASFPVCTKDIGFQTDRIVCTGAAAETYEPRFTYNGFRYVVIRGLRAPLSRGDVTAKFVHTAFPRLSSFDCSDSTFNRLMAMADVAYRANFTDGFPTDCPHREKNGWTGDASIASELAQYCYGNTSGYEKWLRDICDAQNGRGDIPGIVPTAGWGFDWGNGPAWDSALPVIAWNLYVYRGDRRILDEIYPTLKRYLEYTATKSSGGLVSHGLGDWVPPDRRYMPSTGFTSSCYYLQAQHIAAHIAAIKGLTEDAARFAAGAEETRAAINAKYLKGEGTYDNGGQTAQGMALSFGIVPPDRLAAARARLVASFEEAGGKTRMGILGMKHTLRALSDAGRSDLAFAMLTHPGSPSPADWVRKGGTALWEDWSDGASRNHIMFGDFACWAYQRLAGIRLPDGGTAAVPDPSVLAFGEILVAPEFVPQLSHVHARVGCLYGEIDVGWRRTGGTILLDVKVPPNASATLRLPGCPDRRIAAGAHRFRLPDARKR